jgi:hypothetical protein
MPRGGAASCYLGEHHVIPFIDVHGARLLSRGNGSGHPIAFVDIEIKRPEALVQAK